MPIVNSKIPKSVKIWYPELVNIYGTTIGEDTKIASFVEIGNSIIGSRCKIEAFVFIPPKSVVEDDVFIGPHVSFTNDKYPKASSKTWKIEPIIIKKGASIGAGAIICPGVTIGEYALVGAGSVVVKDVLPKQIIHGLRAK